MGSCCGKGLGPADGDKVHHVLVKPSSKKSLEGSPLLSAAKPQQTERSSKQSPRTKDSPAAEPNPTLTPTDPTADYTDTYFPANSSSLGPEGSLKDENGNLISGSDLIWRHDFGEDHAATCVALGHPGENCPISPGSVVQGPLGDCYFVSSLAVLAERPALVRRLFQPSGIPGKVHVILHRPWMEPRQVTIDDTLPCCVNSNTPLFAHCLSQCSWPGLVEKAWAKLHGSYSAIIGGTPGRALEALTGAPTRSLLLCKLSVDELWRHVSEARTSEHLMAATVPDLDQHESGLVRKHAYSLLACETIRENRLVQIRNPWGRAEWKGRWSHTSSSWDNHLEEAKKLGLGNKDDGLFWMSIEDFHTQFEALEVNLCGATTQPPLSTSVRLTGRQAYVRISLTEVPKEKEAYISLSGFDRSVRAAHKPEHHTALSLTVIGPEAGDVKVGEFHDLPHVWTKAPGGGAGEYAVLIERSIIEEEAQMTGFPPERLVITFHSNVPSSAVQFDEIVLEAGSHIFDAKLHTALTLKCKLHGETHSDQQPSEQVTSTEIGMGVALAKRQPLLGCFTKLLKNVSGDCKAEIKVEISSAHNMRLVMPQPGKQMRVSHGLDLLGCGPTGRSNLGSGGLLELTLPPNKSTALVLKSSGPGRTGFEWSFEGSARSALSLEKIATQCRENGELISFGALGVRRIHLHGLYALQLTMNDSPEMVCDVVFQFKLDNLALDERNASSSMQLHAMLAK